MCSETRDSTRQLTAQSLYQGISHKNIICFYCGSLYLQVRGVVGVCLAHHQPLRTARISLVYHTSHHLPGAGVEVVECQLNMSMPGRRGVLACICLIPLERAAHASPRTLVLQVLLRLLSAMPCACGSFGVLFLFFSRRLTPKSLLLFWWRVSRAGYSSMSRCELCLRRVGCKGYHFRYMNNRISGLYLNK